MRDVLKKLSRLKLYLPRLKWTMNETLIFFKIQHMYKKYQDLSYIYRDRNEQSMKLFGRIVVGTSYIPFLY